MQVDLTLKNYRCFSDERPARFAIRRGLTAFVGANNSGKSTLVRFLYEFRNLFLNLSGALPNVLGRPGNLIGFNLPESVRDVNELFHNGNSRDLEIMLEFSWDNESSTSLPYPKTLVLTLPRGTNSFTARLELPSGWLEVPNGHGVGISGTTLIVGGAARVELAPFADLCTKLGQTLYIGPFRNAINVGTNQTYFDIAVGQAFIQSWRALKTGNTIKQSEATYRLTNDIKELFGFSDLEINPSADDTTLQVFVNGKSYKLAELGSGLAQFVLVLATVATRQPAFILIDEPEMNLHPAMQVDFLTTVASYAQLGVLFATHSFGLARTAGDWVHSVTRAHDLSEVHPLEATPRLSEFLGELTFSGFREMGCNTIMLIEGRTDLKPLRRFLHLYGKDHKVALLPLDGGRMINGQSGDQLEEIKRIADTIVAVIDSERATPDAPLSADRQAFVDLCATAGIRCHVLERRALENYLPDQAVKAGLGEKFHALGLHDSPGEAQRGWAKADNWRAAHHVTKEELDATDLGPFLASL
jgi:ABC-type cobalamin/Fe3+-siderophores transport system ATPase subunit